MNTIIQQIVEKIIESVEGNLKIVLKERKNISDFIINLKKTLDEVGTDLTSAVLEEMDQRVKESTNRKQDWVVKSKNNNKSLASKLSRKRHR